MSDTEPTIRSGYVYILQPKGHNVFKVGCTVDPDKRMKRFKRTYEFDVQYVAMRFYPDCENAESLWHTKFKHYHLIGEWYVLPESEVQRFKSKGSL